MVTYEEFKKLDIRVGKILFAEKVAGSEKLIKIEVDLGEEKRKIVAGIGKEYGIEKLLGREIVILANLETRNILGEESQGMLLAADVDGKPILLITDLEVPPGSIVK